MKPRFFYHLGFGSFCGAIIIGTTFADDLIITKSGQEIRARITAFKEGKVTMLDNNGKEQTGKMKKGRANNQRVRELES